MVLTFSVKVAEDDTIATIQSAIRDGKLGKLSVNASYIIGSLPVVPSESSMTPTRTPSKIDGLFQFLIGSVSVNVKSCSTFFECCLISTKEKPPA